MSNQYPLSEIEGRLIAQRRILEILLARLACLQDDDAAFWAEFEDYQMVQSHEEDPGLEPSQAYAVQAAAAFEMQTLVRNARGHAGENK